MPLDSRTQRVNSDHGRESGSDASPPLGETTFASEAFPAREATEEDPLLPREADDDAGAEEEQKPPISVLRGVAIAASMGFLLFLQSTSRLVRRCPGRLPSGHHVRCSS
jgi:hypothetical protein